MAEPIKRLTPLEIRQHAVECIYDGVDHPDWVKPIGLPVAWWSEFPSNHLSINFGIRGYAYISLMLCSRPSVTVTTVTLPFSFYDLVSNPEKHSVTGIPVIVKVNASEIPHIPGSDGNSIMRGVRLTRDIPGYSRRGALQHVYAYAQLYFSDSTPFPDGHIISFQERDYHIRVDVLMAPPLFPVVV